MNNILGIDFGTSNTTLSFWSEQKNAPEVIRAKNGEEKIPSLVYLGTPQQYGYAALDILKNAEYESKQEQEKILNLIVRRIKMELIDNISFYTKEGNEVEACDIVRDFLSYLKQYAENEHFHSPVEELHLCHPVIDSNAFTETARLRLETAAREAGFTKVELIEEPVAAAYGYISQGADVGENVLVYDIGGGTLDLAYLSRDYKGAYHPVKTRSVPNCAGSDFDQLIYKYAASKIDDLEYDENNLSIDILMACQTCKETLSRLDKTYWKVRSHSVQLTREEFENLIRSKIQESLNAAEGLFHELESEGKTIDTFLLIGGSSRIPLIRKEFNRLYEEKRISCKPTETQIRDVAVAWGAVCDPQMLKKSTGKDTDIIIVPIPVEQPKIVIENEQMPPLPDEIIDLQSENQGLESVIDQLEAYTHESQAPINKAIAKAMDEVESWKERKDKSWENLSPEWRESLEKTIADNPNCTEADIQISTENMSNKEYVSLLKVFQSGKNYEQARLALAQLEQQRQEKAVESVSKLKKGIDYNNSQLNILGKHFLDKVLTVILTLMPGYDAADAGFPEGSILQPLLLLDDYNLNWKIKEEMQRARELWKQERPCVFADQEERKKAMLLPGTFAGERKTVVIQNVEFTFRWCPAGTFRMGSPITEDWREKNEKRHRVILSKGFWMMETPVTQEQWQAVTKDNPSHFKGENHPVESVSWNDSQRFCKKCEQLGIPVQLPTETQWEYACRAGSIGPLAGGLREMAWYDDNSSSQTHPVGQKKANAWGLYDMHGNVWEWCEDRYGDYPSEERSDPTGSATGDERVARGGSYNNNYKYCRSAYRKKFAPESIYWNVGLRCAITVDSKAVKSLPGAQNAGSQEPQPKIDAGTRKVFAVKDVEFAFRWCPAGTFMMGSPDSETGRNRNEVLHQVTLTRGFWMMETEVTQKQWSAVMPTNPSKFVNDDQPVESISWDQCQEFCQKCAELGLPLQLPTEAQWEYACRAGCTEAHFGNVDEISWYSSNSRKTTHPVGSMEPNAWGIYDMHGNVWEWCADWFENYPDGNVTDPVGPDSGFDRVKRGGSWFNDASRSRAAYRSHSIPSSKDSIIGFRCVKVQ